MMQYENLSKIIKTVYDFYNQELTPFSFSIWEHALQSFALAEIIAAFRQHMVSSQGRFCPKPADILELLKGKPEDKAILAWSKVYQAIRTLGGGKTIDFNDPICQRVITDLGGWNELCCSKTIDIPFIERRFIERYQIYSKTPELLINTYTAISDKSKAHLAITGIID